MSSTIIFSSLAINAGAVTVAEREALKGVANALLGWNPVVGLGATYAVYFETGATDLIDHDGRVERHVSAYFAGSANECLSGALNAGKDVATGHIRYGRAGNGRSVSGFVRQFEKTLATPCPSGLAATITGGVRTETLAACNRDEVTATRKEVASAAQAAGLFHSATCIDLDIGKSIRLAAGLSMIAHELCKARKLAVGRFDGGCVFDHSLTASQLGQLRVLCSDTSRLAA